MILFHIIFLITDDDCTQKRKLPLDIHLDSKKARDGPPPAISKEDEAMIDKHLQEEDKELEFYSAQCKQNYFYYYQMNN